MNTRSNRFDSFLSVIYSVETCHRSEQCLSRTNIGSGFFAFDMLFACLQSHSVAEFAVFVFGPSDDASRHVPLVLVTCGEVGCRRTTVKHWCTQTLRCTEYDIRSPFSRRSQQGKTQNVSGNGNFAVCFMCLFCEVGIVFHITAGVRILQDAGEDFW